MDGSGTRACVIGVGQAFAGDDGVGREVAKRLRAKGLAALAVDDGAALLSHLLEARGRVVVIDAVVDGGSPGTVHLLDRQELARGPRPVSSHGLSVEVAIDLACRFNPDLDVTVLGVAIERPRSLGAGLSPDVAASVESAAARVHQLIG